MAKCKLVAFQNTFAGRSFALSSIILLCFQQYNNRSKLNSSNGKAIPMSPCMLAMACYEQKSTFMVDNPALLLKRVR